MQHSQLVLNLRKDT